MANGRVDSVCNLLTDFRYFLDYHIKSSKSYLHERMRNRADKWKNRIPGMESSFVVMKEAKFEGEATQKTTVNGKTFVK